MKVVLGDGTNYEKTKEYTRFYGSGRNDGYFGNIHPHKFYFPFLHKTLFIPLL